MAKNSNIEWCDHTFNPWIGCTKVSAGCANCYAEKQDNHRKWTPDGWGKGKPRKKTSEAYWRRPLKWNRDAEGSERRPRVFCASLADVFDSEAPQEWRNDLFDLIEDTPNLDWLLLTKRPENVNRCTPCYWSTGNWPTNVWLGTSVENQQAADERIPHLLKIPAVVRFLSCEPLLEKLRIYNYLKPWKERSSTMYGAGYERMDAQLHWVIGGGESGHSARPCHPDAARSLRDECRVAGVPFLWKQWGEWLPFVGDCGGPYQLSAIDPKSNYGNLLPLDKQEAMWPDGTKRIVALSYIDNDTPVLRVGKKAAGRLLDGRTWDEYPEVNP